MVELLQDEIVAGLRQRGITDRFWRFQSYAAGQLNASAGRYTGSELAGNCRLSWYDHMMRNMLRPRPRPSALRGSCTWPRATIATA